MVAAGPVPRELVPNRVNSGIYGKPTTSTVDSRRSGCKGLGGGLQSSNQLTEVICAHAIIVKLYNNGR